MNKSAISVAIGVIASASLLAAPPASAESGDISLINKSLALDSSTQTATTGLEITSNSGTATANNNGISMQLTGTSQKDIKSKSSGISFATSSNSIRVIRDTEDGFQSLTIHKNRDSMTSSFSFPGTKLVQDQSGGITIMKKGESIGYIESPWAKDSVGKSVKTEFSINGSSLTQTIHPTSDTVFPVTADPKVHRSWWGYTIDFSKSETAMIAAGGITCDKALSKMPVPPQVKAVGMVLCTAASAIAGSALAAGQCVTVKAVLIPTTAIVPWISNCYA